MEKYVRNLMNVFEESFINRLNELILIPKTNLYICLDDVHNETELKYKIIEFCSRDASKAMPYKTERRNKKYQSKVREKINIYLNANFTADDMDLIYTELGNRINHELTIIFVNNNYDLNILKEGNLNKEYQEPVKPTETEKAILKNLPKEFKWIARDECNLILSEEKPLKVNDYWRNTTGFVSLNLFSHLFDFIKCEDKEPHNIEDLLKEN